MPGIRKYTLQDGYTATRGYEIQQDSKGYIWLGTDNGGLSFDGQTFRVAQDISHSSDAEILICCPLAGSRRVLLLPLANNISYIDKGRFITSAEDSELANTKMAFNMMQLDHRTGAWWLSDAKRLDVLYRFLDNKIRRYQLGAHSFHIGSIISNRFIGYQQIGRAHDYCLYVYDTIGNRHYLYDEDGRKKEHGQEVTVDHSGNPRYISTFNPVTRQVRIYNYQPGDTVLKCIRRITLPFQKTYNVPQVLIDQNDCLWLKASGDYNGILYYGDIRLPGNRGLLLHLEEPALTNSIFVDRNSNLWLSSSGNALYFLSRKHLQNLLLTSRFPYKQEIPQAISGDGAGGMCISYANRAALSCVRGDHFKIITLNNGFVQGSRHILSLDSTRFLLFNRDIAVYDIRKGTLDYFTSKIPWLLYKDACTYGREGVLLASTDGVYYTNWITKGREQPEKLFDKRASAVAVLADKRILIGAPDGLYIKERLEAPAVKSDHPVLGTSNITCILALHNGGALVGTNAQGVFLLQDIGKKIQQLGISGHEGARQIRRLYRQNDNTYWIATDDGAYAIGFDHRWSVAAVKNYNFYDGLPSNNVTDIYVCRDTAYFATTQGLGIIPLKDASFVQMPPPDIYINTIRAGDTVFHEPGGMISLPFDRHDLLISLSAISYESQGNIRYYYQLYPFQDGWAETTSPEVRFSGIPPGEYTFRVYAVNAKGIRSRQSLALPVRIKPAFWQTVWFRIGLFLLAGILIYLVTRRRIQQLEKKKYEALQQKKRLAELELEAIKAQINPHFIYNCLNSIKYLHYKAEYKQTEEYLSIFARLIRMTMQYSRRTFITLAEEAEYLSNYLRLEKLRFKDQLQYAIDIEAGINMQIVLPAMLLQPYVENALKHGIRGKAEKGAVWIIFREEDGCIEVLIKDNGPGFSGFEGTDALGMHLSGTRAHAYNELFNLDISVAYYNEQSLDPGKTGAVVKITIRTNSYEAGNL